MREILAVSPQQQFFMASDSPDLINDFAAKFGNHRIKTAKVSEYDRQKQASAVQAFVDFLCLSRTDEIIGSFWSSFTIEAARLGGIPYRISQNSEPDIKAAQMNSQVRNG